MAAGGVGGYFGARLAAAGEDVHFIARGTHLKAIKQIGLKLESALGDLHVVDARATDDPGTIGTADIVLFAVKARRRNFLFSLQVKPSFPLQVNINERKEKMVPPMIPRNYLGGNVRAANKSLL